MGFLDWLRGESKRPVEDHAISSGYSFFFGGTSSGRPVTERSAMQMTAVYLIFSCWESVPMATSVSTSRVLPWCPAPA